ncbi:MAG TPA: MFS transporter, partial [Spirochaetia bacterium]|nr:MFS transporter [Spirochaetia bacterium]
ASPIVGAVVDRFSRKSLLLACELFGLSSVLVFSVWGFSTGHYENWQLVAIYVAGITYYSTHYPSQFAFVQEIFNEEQYHSLNSVMEVQNQTSSMLAGALASVLIGKVNLTYILWADGLTYLIAFFAFLSLSYVRAEGVGKARFNLFSGIAEGFTYLKTKPLLILFFLCSLMPFISVMVGNYLFPVYILKTLQAGPSVLGAHETTYAVGAILAGLTIPLLLKRLGTLRSILITAGTYTIAIALVAFIPVVGLFLSATVLMGWGNAGTRVGRSSYLMKVVPKSIIGRVNSFFAAFGYAMRLVLIGSFASIINRVGPPPMLMFVGVLLCIAFVGVLASRSLFKEAPAAPLAARAAEPTAGR